MKTKKLLKIIGLTTILTSVSAEVNEAERTFCAAVGFTGALDTVNVSSPCVFDDTHNKMAGWVSVVKGSALVGTLVFGAKGSGIFDGDTFDIKKIVFAAGLAALSLQYQGIMNMISGFFA